MKVFRKSIVAALLVLTPLLFPQTLHAQGSIIAPIAPRNTSFDKLVITTLQSDLDSSFSVIDPSRSLSALNAFESVEPFNLNVEDARNLGEAVGTDVLMVVEASLQPRTRISSPTAYEAFVSIHLIGARSGMLLGWRLFTVDEDSEAEAARKLMSSIPSVTAWIRSVTGGMKATEASFTEHRQRKLLEDFSVNTVKAPAPYRRLSPTYTEQARLYGKEGTVEIQVDLDKDGEIKDTRIMKWVGFGLEESVTEAIRRMNWRPAYSGSSAIPSRFIVRYNFKRQ